MSAACILSVSYTHLDVYKRQTYAPVDVLQSFFEPVLAFPDVVGLAVATRADCLPEPVLDYLADLSCRTDLTVELGLQTCLLYTSAFLAAPVLFPSKSVYSP